MAIGIYNVGPQSDPGNQENNCFFFFREIIMFGISPMTTEFFIVRGALFRRKRFEICNFPRDQWRTRAASSNTTSSHTHALCHGPFGSRRHSECFFTNYCRKTVLRNSIFSCFFFFFFFKKGRLPCFCFKNCFVMFFLCFCFVFFTECARSVRMRNVLKAIVQVCTACHC